MTQPKFKKLLFLLLQLTTFLFIWQILMLFYSGDDSIIVKIVLHRVFFVPAYVWVEIVAYFIAELLIYLLLTYLLWFCVKLVAERFLLAEKQAYYLALTAWWVAVLLLYFANEIFYPNSLFGLLFFTLFSFPVANITFAGLLLLFGVFLLIALLQIFKQHYRKILFWLLLSGSIILVAAYYVYPAKERAGRVQVGSYQQPNIFVIGLDAVRPDRLHVYGYAKNQSPYIDQFVRQATSFRNSITPIARTSPAWVSILTGQYPKHNGVRFNLMPQQGLKLDDSLGYVLRRAGYYTIFATDGRRFDFIGHDFGFQSVLGASGTVSNFLMGLIDNTPIVDLLSNTFLGDLIFPNIYGNRDIGFTYHPSSFMRVVKQQIPKNIHQPIFMCIHFTLSHFPYIWAHKLSSWQASASDLYDVSIKRVDQQFGAFMRYLDEQGLLRNAIVILISDHGEALALPGDRMLSKKYYIKGKQSRPDVFDQLNALQQDNHSLRVSAGHGTDVLSYSQYNNLLAFRAFGQQKKIAPSMIKQRVSLIDIKPTLLAWLGLVSKRYDGMTLLPYFKKPNYQGKPRARFAEIGFTPISLKTTKVSVPNAIFQSADFFAIQPKTHRVIMKPQAAKKMLKTKQRAIYYKQWVLALYPDKQYKLFPVLVNRKTGQWTDDLSTPFAKQSPASDMLNSLRHFYGKEVTDYLKLR